MFLKLRTYLNARALHAGLSCLVLFAASGCASFAPPQTDALLLEGLPPRHQVANVPVIKQADHYCGPAAVATLAQFNKVALSQEAAAQMVYTPGRKGTFQHDVVAAMQRLGFLMTPVNNMPDAVRELAANNPVIIFQNLGLSWYPVWHYSVFAGYDLGEQTLLVHNGKATPHWKTMTKVGNTWQRAGLWGYVATPPGIFPATADEMELLQATAGLEQAGHMAEAATSYQAIVEAFPQSAKAHLGLGNIAMGQKAYKKAQLAYQKALQIDPAYDLARNNLAYSLNNQGENSQACALLAPFKDAQKEHTNLYESYQELCTIKP